MPQESANMKSIPDAKKTVDLPESTLTVQEAIDLIGNGRVQYFALLASLLGLMSYATDILGFGLVIPAANCDLQLTTLKKGLLSSVPYLGLTLSSHAWGFLSDFIGRRKVILLSLSSCIFASLTAALVPDYWIILVMRLISGMCLSGATTAMYPFIGELLSNSGRSKCMVIIGYALGLGILTSTGIGWIVHRFDFRVQITEEYSIQPWRWQMILAMLPACAATIIYYCLPESPVFLSHTGENEKVMQVLRSIHKRNRKGVDKFPLESMQLEVAEKHSRKISTVVVSFLHETKSLFHKPCLWPMLGSCLIQCALFTVSGVFTLWYPEITRKLNDNTGGSTLCAILTELNANGNETIPLTNFEECSVEIPAKVYNDNIVIGIGYLAANAIVYFCNMKFRLLHLTLATLVLSSTAAFLLPNLTNEVLIMISFTVFITGGSIGISLFLVVMVEIFPADLCGMAIGLSLLVGRSAVFIGTNGVGVLLETYCSGVIYGTATLLIASICCLVLLPTRIVRCH